MVNILERRLELLKLESLGLTKAEVVTTLSQKFQCSARNIYRDYSCRRNWQPLINEIQPDEILLKTVNRTEEIYRKASLRYLQATSDLAAIAALNVMLRANEMLFELGVLPDALSRLKDVEDKLAKGGREE